MDAERTADLRYEEGLPDFYERIEAAEVAEKREAIREIVAAHRASAVRAVAALYELGVVDPWEAGYDMPPFGHRPSRRLTLEQVMEHAADDSQAALAAWLLEAHRGEFV